MRHRRVLDFNLSIALRCKNKKIHRFMLLTLVYFGFAFYFSLKQSTFANEKMTKKSTNGMNALCSMCLGFAATIR